MERWIPGCPTQRRNPLVSWNGTFFISRSTSTRRGEQLIKLYSIINSIIILVSKFAVGLEKVGRVPAYDRKSLLTYLSRETFDFALTKVLIYFSPNCLLMLKFRSFGENGCSIDFRLANNATCSVLFSGSWSSWNTGMFEKVVVFLPQIFALSKKIDSQFISVLSRISSTRRTSQFGLGQCESRVTAV